MGVNIGRKSAKHMKAPCVDCPYTKDSLAGWLGAKRVKYFLSQTSFLCHKHRMESVQCAGHMIIRKEKNDFYALAQRMGIDLSLRGHDKVFNSTADCIDHHKEVGDMDNRNSVTKGSKWRNKNDGRFINVVAVNSRHVYFKYLDQSGKKALILQTGNASINSFLSAYELVKERKIVLLIQDADNVPWRETYYIDFGVDAKAWAVEMIDGFNEHLRPHETPREVIEVISGLCEEGASNDF